MQKIWGTIWGTIWEKTKELVVAGISWDLLDTFSQALAAGSVNNTLSDSGHVRTVVDTESKLSITGGNLSFSGGKASPADGDPGIWYPVVTRVAGLMGGWNLTTADASNTFQFGWDANTSGAITGQQYRVGSDTLKPYPGGTAGPTLFVPLDGTNYTFLAALRATGAFLFGKGGTLTNFTLLWSDVTGSTASLYPSYSNFNSAFTSSYIGIPSTRWLPTPLLSQGFGGTIGTSDGAGHAETTGLGSGGSGVTMTGATWAISGGKAVNTPTEGEEKIADGTFATACGAGNWTCGTNWNIAGGVATKDPASSGHVLSQTTAPLASGIWYKATWDLTVTSGNFALLYFGSDSSTSKARTATGSYVDTNRSNGTAASVLGGSTYVGTVDNLSYKPLTLSTLFLTAPLSTSNVVASADLTITAGTQAGLGLRLDSAASPTKGFVCYHDGVQTLKCDEFTTATSWTNDLTYTNAAINYVAGAKIVIVTDGTAYRAYYNNVLCGIGTMSATITGTIHGLFSTSASNSIDNLVIYARGTDGEYETALNQYVI